jgi:hypothetical protein
LRRFSGHVRDRKLQWPLAPRYALSSRCGSRAARALGLGPGLLRPARNPRSGARAALQLHPGSGSPAHGTARVPRCMPRRPDPAGRRGMASTARSLPPLRGAQLMALSGLQVKEAEPGQPHDVAHDAPDIHVTGCSVGIGQHVVGQPGDDPPCPGPGWRIDPGAGHAGNHGEPREDHHPPPRSGPIHPPACGRWAPSPDAPTHAAGNEHAKLCLRKTSSILRACVADGRVVRAPAEAPAVVADTALVPDHLRCRVRDR